jgi:AcrR family transcriptional regulator
MASVDAGPDHAAHVQGDDQRDKGDRQNDPDDNHPSRPGPRGYLVGSSPSVRMVGGAERVSQDELLVSRSGRYRDILSMSTHHVSKGGSAYTSCVPKLWTETIETHRREVREAILDTTAALVAELGPLGVTMSQIAEETGIGRATLYKYFPDVEAILLAWHDREIAAHLAYLAEVKDRSEGAGERLEAVLEAYALLSHHPHGHQDSSVVAVLHRQEQVAQAEREVHRMVQDLLVATKKTGRVRDDVPADELATYCVHALGGAGAQRSKAAVRRLVSVTLAGLRPQR